MLALLKMYWISLGLLVIVELANSSSPIHTVHNNEDSLKYEPTWESLDTRPLPSWYDEAKFGIFIHWGVFSVPSFGSEWFWDFWQGQNRTEYEKFMTKNYAPGFSYQDFARDFTAEFYNPKDWAEIFHSSGAKYVVLTTKHHEGYTLWPSQYSFSWNAQDVGPHRDLVGELATAIRTKTDLKFGLYHSLFEWFNPLYVKDRENNFTTQRFVDQKTMPELYELVNNYEPDIIWSDGEGEAPDSYWRSKNFIAWLYNETPKKETVVVNDRWGSGVPCNHGDFYTCADRYNPGVLQPHKWENCMTIDKKSWGFRRNAKLKDFLTMEDLIKELVQTVSCGGNLLMNIGPTKDGIITPIFEERLRGMGSWLKINGEAIYGSKPWTYQNDTLTTGVWYTMTGDNELETSLYAMVLRWPTDNMLHLGAPQLSQESSISLLGYPSDLQWETNRAGITVHFPNMADVSSNWAWTLKISKAIESEKVLKIDQRKKNTLNNDVNNAK